MSFNVVEHLYDVERAFANMAALLRPGGAMIHRVDCSAHGHWGRYRDDLMFLTIPDHLWRAKAGLEMSTRSRRGACLAPLRPSR